VSRFFFTVAVTMGLAMGTMSVSMIRTMGFMQHFHVFKLMTLTGHDAEGCERQQ
jgi:hypothetical protein